jgi:hypothetical protein
MAGRPQGASQANAAAAVLDGLYNHMDIAVVSNDVERLLYSYLDLFHTAKENPAFRSKVEFIVTAGLRGMFEVLHSAFISRQLDHLDSYLAAQYGTTISSWAESRWLYWFVPDRALR